MTDGRILRRHVELAQRILDLASERGLAPGARLAEQSLATQCQVSRTPVRKALQLLAARGLVVPEAEGGFVLAADPVTLPRLEVAAADDAGQELFCAVLRDLNAGRIGGAQNAAGLQRRYGASRKAVQNALQKLSEENFAMRGGGQQWWLKPFAYGAGAAAKSFEFRLAMEPLALCLPEHKRDMAALMGLKQAMMVLRAMAEADFDRLLFERTDFDFHMMLARGCGNPFLAEALAAHHRQRQALGLGGAVPSRRLMQSNEEHIAILEQMERGQFELAADLLRVHLRQSQSVRPRLAGRGVPAAFVQQAH